jgi:predicted nucleic acid-binding protein
MATWAVDTSVVVAALVVGHEHEAVAVPAARRKGTSLPVHVAVEAFAVLTRLPGVSFRPDDALSAIAQTFQAPWLTLDATRSVELLTLLGERGIGGGRVYDGLVAMTAKVHHATLVTLDRRAVPTYEAVGARFELII